MQQKNVIEIRSKKRGTLWKKIFWVFVAALINVSK
jgi:hypothetical protein